MFTGGTRTNWLYLIKANYDNSETILLPVPRQSKRNFLQWLLFDFKEGKFTSNIRLTRFPYARERYARYLCRKHPKHNNSKIKSIIFEEHLQNVLSTKDARIAGTYLDSHIKKNTPDIFRCPKNENIF